MSEPQITIGPQKLLLRVEDVAAALSVSVRKVWQMASAGDLPQPIHLGRTTRWRRADLEAWIENLSTAA